MKLVYIFLFFTAFNGQAQTTTAFCFEKTIDVKSALKDVESLVVEGDKILEQKGSLCFDIVTSSEMRIELFEKLLRRRYQLTKSISETPSQHSTCNIVFEMIGTKEIKKEQVSIGEFSKISDEASKSKQTNVQNFLIDENTKGMLRVCDSVLEIVCRKVDDKRFVVKISHTDLQKSVETTVTLLQNVKFDLGNVVKDLNDKKKTLGIPETSMIKTEGFEQVQYSLIIQ